MGTISFTDEEGSFLSSMELQGTPQNDFAIPLAAEDCTYFTGIALLNAGDSSAQVSLELWNADGTLERGVILELPAGVRTARYLEEYFAGTPNIMVANVRIHSNQPLFGSGLLHDRNLNFLCAMSAINIPPKQ